MKGQAGKKKAMKFLIALGKNRPFKKAQIGCSFQHLSHSHIIPRTLPVVVIIFAAVIGLPQH